jgi:thiol-disulfide isomerase/thioredoxin
MLLGSIISVKNLIQYSILIVIFLTLWKCQVLKEPAAAIMSKTLPTPEIDSSISNHPDASYNLQVKDLNGQIVNMEDYRGKVIFLNFWATWCMPCVAELPSIDKLYKEFKNKNIAFLLISNEELEKVASYHEKKEYDVPFHIMDQDGNIPNIYFSPSIPTTFIINKEGKIVKSTRGAEDWDDEEFVQVLKEMI